MTNHTISRKDLAFSILDQARNIKIDKQLKHVLQKKPTQSKALNMDYFIYQRNGGIIDMYGKVIDVSLFGFSPAAVYSNHKTKDSNPKDCIQLRYWDSDESIRYCEQVVQSSSPGICNKYSIEYCVFSCSARIEYLILDYIWY
ncbi:hypothetical protein RFI_04316 [Reticulomyxa filosa]|uniref:Uncharacterized protein n=1 Tax=Reticulomyxa filosa TaxID=46433 RepID=X6P2L3_RETFI|nr:hypothetical protein RFI_04316 [Reticulomyxa filosa]|eukprot:ETO32800.1 hypothetical protein RFI_04316 [Reticulomyxa filosa]